MKRIWEKISNFFKDMREKTKDLMVSPVINNFTAGWFFGISLIWTIQTGNPLVVLYFLIPATLLLFSSLDITTTIRNSSLIQNITKTIDGVLGETNGNNVTPFNTPNPVPQPS